MSSSYLPATDTAKYTEEMKRNVAHSILGKTKFLSFF